MIDEERTIIGGWLLDRHLEDIELLDVSDFETYGKMVSVMKRGCKNPFEIFSISGVPVAEQSKFLELYSETFYFQAMKSMLRRKAAMAMRNMKTETVDSAMELYFAYKNYGNEDQLPQPFRNFGSKYIEELDRRSKTEIITTGFPTLDKLMVGLKPKELTVISGRPATGKSALALQIAIRIASQGKKVLFFPLEMSAIQTIERMILGISDIKSETVRSGKLQRSDWGKIGTACEGLEEFESEDTFRIYEGVNQFEMIEKLVQREKPFAIVIDQLEQMRACEKFIDKRQRFSYMTNNLKRLAMTENIAVFMLAQLRRDNNAEPTLESLKESGSIEEDADNVILLHRYPAEAMNNPSEWSESKRPIRMELAKQRSGPTGKLFTVFAADKLRFHERKI